ncbi:helix-turn-helix domain-containing protein [Patescibacteria group bacterium]|nr:helix-turn-helix domain-containing protein [Patescibacteria group bacterium]
MKRSNFRQLSISDRIRIEVCLSQGKTQYEIAKILKVHRSTVSREVKNRGGILRGYVADYAQKDYEREKEEKPAVKSFLTVFGLIIDQKKLILVNNLAIGKETQSFTNTNTQFNQ